MWRTYTQGLFCQIDIGNLDQFAAKNGDRAVVLSLLGQLVISFSGVITYVLHCAGGSVSILYTHSHIQQATFVFLL